MHTIVIGGSIAGLLAARILRDHFGTVAIVERDHLPEHPGPRAGAPQAAHQHVLMLRGLRIIEALFPGIRNELAAAGAVVLDMAADVAWLTPAGWGVRFDSDLKLLTCSRDLLEWTIRKRLLALDGIRVLEGADVSGLLHESGRVVGVRVRQRHVPATDRAERAQLVIDASGRSSKLPEWLQAIGYGRPAERVVNGFLGYASRIFRMPDVDLSGWRGAYVQPAPPVHTRGGVVLPIEGRRWQVTLAGVGGDYPPIDEPGFLDFAASLRTPILFDAIRKAEPLSPIAGFRATENRWRSYESTRLPEGLIALGDAVCAFNPVYAQGMTAAAVAAETLSKQLGRQPRRNGTVVLTNFAQQFQRELARANQTPWQMATSEDLRLPQTTGARRTLATRLGHAYIDRIVELTTERPEVRLAFLRGMNMLDGPASLFAPHILRAVLGPRRRTIAVASSDSRIPTAKAIQSRVQLLHLKHRLHHALCFLRVRVGQQLRKRAWPDLP